MLGITTAVAVASINTTAKLTAPTGLKVPPGLGPKQITLTGPPPPSIQIGTSLTLMTMPVTAANEMTQETAIVYAINGSTLTVSQCTQAAGATISVQNDPPLSWPANCPYRIIRSPRPVAGEDGLTLPLNVAIQVIAPSQHGYTGGTPAPNYDPPATVTPPPPPPPGTPVPPPTVWYDILFSPSGAVVGSAAGNDKVVLWVRDVTQPNVADNNAVLVCIYTRSGLIAAHPVDVTPGGNPYSFTVDGKSSAE